MRKLGFLCLVLSVGGTSAYSIVDDSVIKVDLQVDEIVAAVTPTGTATNLRDLIDQRGGVAGMNGAYFCPDESAYSRCGDGNTTTSLRVVDGVLHSKYGKDTGTQGVMWFSSDNDVVFVQNNFGYVGNYENNTNKDRYDEIYNGIGNFPILLDQWVDPLAYYDDVIDSKMKAKATKWFICHTQDGRYVYLWFVRNKSIYDMPGYLKDRYDCYNAINLDAGWSSALYADQTYIVWPGRNIVDAFVICGKQTWTAPMVVTDIAVTEDVVWCDGIREDNTEYCYTVDEYVTLLPQDKVRLVHQLVSLIESKSVSTQQRVQRMLESFVQTSVDTELVRVVRYVLYLLWK